jgi:hypothetical protein
MVKQDYMVVYEGICDPNSKSCFISCEDDDCTKGHYYSRVEKYAPDLYKECGKDITDCRAASACIPGDHKCSITYCETGVDGNNCSEANSQNNNLNDTNI